MNRTAGFVRAWRAAGGRDGRGLFVVDCGPAAHRAVGLDEYLPEGPWREQHAYAVIDAAGELRERCEVTSWSIEDELGASLFAVDGGALRNLSVSVFFMAPFRERHDQKTVVDGLEPVADDDGPTLAFLAAALERVRQAEMLEQERRDRAGEARLDAIPGARDDHGIGTGFRRAQEVLCQRVRMEERSLYAAMLRALVRFGVLYRSMRGEGAVPATLDLAMDAFVTACRTAAFDRTLQTSPPESTARANTGTIAASRDFEQQLAAIERDLMQNAEHQEWVDARLNAIALRSAAGHVACAREILAGARKA